jgi:hypothetical protein
MSPVFRRFQALVKTEDTMCSDLDTIEKGQKIDRGARSLDPHGRPVWAGA